MDVVRETLVLNVIIPSIDHVLIIENNLPKARELTEKRLIHHPSNEGLLQRRDAFSLLSELILYRNNKNRQMDIMTCIQQLDEYEFLQDYSYLWYLKLTVYQNAEMYEESSNAGIRLQEIGRRLELDISVFGHLPYIAPTKWAYMNARYDEALAYINAGLEKFETSRHLIDLKKSIIKKKKTQIVQEGKLVTQTKQVEITQVEQKYIVNTRDEHDVVETVEDIIMGPTIASEESSLWQKRVKKYEFRTCLTFFIDNLDCSGGENVICYGWMCSKSYRKKVSFLKLSKLEDYPSEKVHLLKSQHILNVICVIKDEQVCRDSELLVVEDHITSLDTFFSLKWQSYCKTENDTKFDKWWLFVQACFNNIYREIIKMMHFLFDNDMVVKDFFERIYVTYNETCVVLPTQVTSNYTKIDDCKALKKAMNFHLRGKCDGPKEYPKAINTWFQVIIHKYWSKIDPNWLIECSHFWSATKRIMFLEILHDLTKMNYVKKNTFNTILYHTKPKNNTTKWYELFREGTVFSQIVAKANIPDSAAIGHSFLPKNVVVVREYKNDVDILRFFNSAKRHYNDEIYKGFRAKELEKSEIEEEFRCVFPDIYTLLCKALLLYLHSVVDDSRRAEIEKKLLTLKIYD